MSISYSGLAKTGTYDEPAVESHVSLFEIASLQYHLVDEREDAEKGYWLDHTSEAEEEDLELGEGRVLDIVKAVRVGF